MKPSGIQVNKPVIAFLGVVVVALIWYLTSRSSTPESVSVNKEMNKAGAQSGQDTSKDSGKAGGEGSDVKKDTVKSVKVWDPNNVPESEIAKIKVEPVSYKVKGGKSELTIQGLSVVPSGNSKRDILLLHGASFNPDNWQKIKTLQLFGVLGYRLLAVTLPEIADPDDKLKFMTDLIQAAKLKKPVIVSPSKSGEYSLLVLMKSPESIGGFFALAPVNTEKFNVEEYKKVKVPSFIMYGENDTGLGKKSYENLKNIPNYQTFAVKDGRHAFYINTPAIFHEHLYKFLEGLKS